MEKVFIGSNGYKISEQDISDWLGNNLKSYDALEAIEELWDNNLDFINLVCDMIYIAMQKI